MKPTNNVPRFKVYLYLMFNFNDPKSIFCVKFPPLKTVFSLLLKSTAFQDRLNDSFTALLKYKQYSFLLILWSMHGKFITMKIFSVPLSCYITLMHTSVYVSSILGNVTMPVLGTKWFCMDHRCMLNDENP